MAHIHQRERWYIDNLLCSMVDQPEYLTREKFEELQKELNYLKTTQRKEIAENLEYAKSLGDLSENAEYHEARGAQTSLEERIAKLEAIFKSAVITEPHHTNVVDVGSAVILQKLGSGTPARFQIVGSEEADIKKDKLSIHAPLGAAVLGKKKGDTIEVHTPSGTVSYRIINIE